MANECIPFKEDGEHVSGKVKTAQITGKRLVNISGPRTSGGVQGLVPDSATDKSGVYQIDQNTVAGEYSLGVAAYDADVGVIVGVICAGIVPITAGAAITAGQLVMSDSQGRVVPWVFAASDANQIIGIAMDSQATVGADCEVCLRLGV